MYVALLKCSLTLTLRLSCKVFNAPKQNKPINGTKPPPLSLSLCGLLVYILDHTIERGAHQHYYGNMSGVCLHLYLQWWKIDLIRKQWAGLYTARYVTVWEHRVLWMTSWYSNELRDMNRIEIQTGSFYYSSSKHKSCLRWVCERHYICTWL